LKRHVRRLAELPYAVLVTKQDLLDETAAAEAVDMVREWGRGNGALEVLPISSATGQGIGELKKLLLRLYRSNFTESVD
jgi:ethanolamine utilization protein EutP (predicted NTPase)